MTYYELVPALRIVLASHTWGRCFKIQSRGEGEGLSKICRRICVRKSLQWQGSSLMDIYWYRMNRVRGKITKKVKASGSEVKGTLINKTLERSPVLWEVCHLPHQIRFMLWHYQLHQYEWLLGYINSFSAQHSVYLLPILVQPYWVPLEMWLWWNLYVLCQYVTVGRIQWKEKNHSFLHKLLYILLVRTMVQ